jgi:biotin carboxyl carrier protein
VLRHPAGGEIRLNATNRALQPHAGGVIASWSAPQATEIRDDQGIGTPNPDTGSFVHYNLAGAYDSNIALVISQGKSRADILERLAEILRTTELRGYDLETNLLVHYGLLCWMIGQEPLVKPSTQFMSYYLAAVGALADVTRSIDFEYAWKTLLSKQADKDARATLALKQTLFLRPLTRLLDHPHLLAGFYGRYAGKLFKRTGGDKGKGERFEFVGNPLDTLRELYHYLALDSLGKRPAAETIWDHDERILENARDFYATLGQKLGTSEWSKLTAALNGSALSGIDAELWQKAQAAHRGFQLGVEILLLPAALAHEAKFDQIRVDEKLEVSFPEFLQDAKRRSELHKLLAPAPLASSDEILTPMGGHFYAREAPHLPPLASEGMHFEAGQPLFVIEVMKMFNKVSVPFSGTITKLLMPESTDAKIVAKGQAIFKIEPDHKRVEESAEEIAARRQALTTKLFGLL